MKLTNLETTYGACEKGAKWAEGKTVEEAWTTCPDGSWMTWFLATLGLKRKRLVLILCDIADLAKQWRGEAGDKAIDVARKWCRGEATIDEVRAAADATFAAFAAFATYAVNAATFAANAAADAAANAAADARVKTLAQAAEIVRGAVTWQEVEGLVGKHNKTAEGD